MKRGTRQKIEMLNAMQMKNQNSVHGECNE